MTGTRVLGIDPGTSGAIALVNGALVEAYDIAIAGTPAELNIDEVARIIRDAKPDIAVIERASAMPKQGVSSTFKFRQAYGALRAIVAMQAVPQHLVTPATWKRYFKLSADKEQSRALALRLWPGCNLLNLKKHHQRAEACLIARWGAEVLWRPQIQINKVSA